MRFAPLLLLSLFLLATACTEPEPDPQDEEPTPEAEPDPDPPAPLAELSEGECPDLSAPGTSTFLSAGLQREVTVLFPDEPEGLPVIFFWHALGTTAAQWIAWFDLEEFAEDAIVVVPSSRETEPFEWDWVAGEEADGPLYDDLRTCVVQELGGDIDRVIATGFSAGAVWTTWLAMHRGDTLATIFAMSGGTVVNLPYEPPAQSMPVFVMSGGETDVWPNQQFPVADFETATQEFSESLIAAGHFVVQCRHDGGHQPGPGAQGMMEDWVFGHRYDVESPWADGTESVDDFEDYCFLPGVD